jgi:type VI secretion system secreted protein Hcp
LVPVGGTVSTVEIHLDLVSIQGESLSSAHLNEIEVDSFSWGVSNSAVNTQSGGIKGGKVSMKEITVTKNFDKSSPGVLKAVAAGQVFKTAKISWSKSTGGKRPEDFVVIVLTGVLITSVVQNSERTGEGMGTETITLAYDKISMDYKWQDKTGLLISAGQMAYDLAQGKIG